MDVVAEGFLALKDSHEKHVNDFATHFAKIISDMMTLAEKLRETFMIWNSKFYL